MLRVDVLLLRINIDILHIVCFVILNLINSEFPRSYMLQAQWNPDGFH